MRPGRLRDVGKRCRVNEGLRRALLLAGAACFVAVAGVALVWFVVFSGLNEPVQFIYGGF